MKLLTLEDCGHTWAEIDVSETRLLRERPKYFKDRYDCEGNKYEKVYSVRNRYYKCSYCGVTKGVEEKELICFQKSFMGYHISPEMYKRGEEYT